MRYPLLKKFREYACTSCLYTVLMTLFLCIFSLLSDISNAGFSVKQFLLLLLFGAILTASAALLHIKSVSAIVCRLLHYAVTMISFLLIAVATDKLDSKAGKIIVAAVVYTCVYAIFVSVGKLMKKQQKKPQ